MSADLIDSGELREPAPLVSAVRVVRERWQIIVAVTALCLIAVLGLSLTATKEYEATSSLLYDPSPLTILIDPNTRQERDPQRALNTALLLVTSSQVAAKVAKDLGGDADSLVGQVGAEVEPEADLINITATDPDPALAARIANAFAAKYVEYDTELKDQNLKQSEDTYRRQLKETDVFAERVRLGNALENVVKLRVSTTSDFKKVGDAKPPSSASSPQPKRDAALGLVLGLVAGLGVAFLIDLFDRRVKSLEDFEALYGIRALTSIPARTRDPATQRERQAALEPFRILRNGLGFLSVSSEIRVVLVTSAVPGEGKSTVAAGLARATALAGQRVVLVEADLRRPTFHEQFNLGDDHRGLTTALVGGVHVGELLRPVLPGLRTMSVLPSGPLPPNSAELLRSAEMGELLRDLANEADIVILDAPPLLPVADAQVLLDHPQVDACLVVARAYQTTREEARRARAVLERHQLRNLGLVVNALRELDAGYEYYGASEERGSLPEPDLAETTE